MRGGSGLMTWRSMLAESRTGRLPIAAAPPSSGISLRSIPATSGPAVHFGASLKPTSNAPWIRTATRGHRRHDDRAQAGIQFVRGHDDTGTGLLNVVAERGI
jgi:hypothetical protein